jgi:hypothetical protein
MDCIDPGPAVPRPPIKVPAFPPPPILLWPAPEGSAVRRLRRAYRLCWWRRQSRKTLQRLAGGYLAWPVASLFLALRNLRVNGAHVNRNAGIGFARQVLGQLHVALIYRLLPQYYYVFELYRPELGCRAAEYVTRVETKSGIYRALKLRGDRSKIVRIKDKTIFSSFFIEHGLRVVPLLAAYKGGERLPGIGVPDPLGQGDLFIKVVEGRGGSGAEVWRVQPDGRYRNAEGVERRGPEILGYVAELSRRDDYLVQPRLINHPAIADLTPGALPTVRLLTVLDESGEPEALNAAFRMAIRADSAVDNFHAGGIAAAVDIKTGRLGPATGLGRGGDFSWHERHPATGGIIAGRVLPDWPEAVALAVAAHRLLGKRVVVGWDIGFLPDGPCLVEGNAGPDIDIHQRIERRPIGNERFGQLMAFHLEKRLAIRP